MKPKDKKSWLGLTRGVGAAWRSRAAWPARLMERKETDDDGNHVHKDTSGGEHELEGSVAGPKH